MKAMFKPVLFLLCLLPFALLVQGAWTGDLGGNPVERVTHVTGEWTLRFLLLTLTMTPVRLLSGQAWPIRIRRMLGLFTFFYASLHLLTWAWLDQQMALQSIGQDILQRPFVTVGFAAWLLMLPLAVTSNNWSIRRLGRRWRSLHRAIYVIAILGVLHYWWLVKADIREPLVYALLLLLLLGFRTSRGRTWAGRWLARWQSAAG